MFSKFVRPSRTSNHLSYLLKGSVGAVVELLFMMLRVASLNPSMSVFFGSRVFKRWRHQCHNCTCCSCQCWRHRHRNHSTAVSSVGDTISMAATTIRVGYTAIATAFSMFEPPPVPPAPASLS